jgi:hypothetical protein
MWVSVLIPPVGNAATPGGFPGKSWGSSGNSFQL